MHFSQVASAALAGFAGLAQATAPVAHKAVARDISPASFALDHSWANHVLFDGVCAPATATASHVTLGLNLNTAQVAGSVSLDIEDSFLIDPIVKLGLGGVTAYIEVDVAASAAVYESIELFASPELSIDVLDILQAKLGAAFALDLVLGVDAAIDVTAGIYIEFAEDAFVELSLITKDVTNLSIDGLKTKALPVGVGAEVDLAAEIKLELGLRLRSQIGISAEVGIAGLDLINGEAQVSLWVNLFDYTAVMVSTSDCLLSVSEAVALTLGIAVELDVDVLDILDLSLAPTAFVTLADTKLNVACMSSRGSTGPFISGSPAGGASATAPATTTAVAAQTTPGYVTSTATSTRTYTVTSCAASVPNCPASYTQKVVTSTVIETTTYCPVTATEKPTSSSATPVSVTTVTDKITTVVPCQTRTTSHFTPPPTTAPKPAPTITIVDTTTWCPVTATESMTASSKPASTGAVTTAVTTPANNGTWTWVPSASASASAPGAPSAKWTPKSSGVVGATSPAPVAPQSSPCPESSAPVAPQSTPCPESPVPMTGTQPGGVMTPVPAPSSNMTSFATVPCATNSWTSAPASQPTVPLTAGAGALQVGVFAVVIPAMVAAML